MQKSAIPTSYLLEIVVLTPGGPSSCIPYSTTSLKPFNTTNIATSTVTQTVTKTNTNCFNTITVTDANEHSFIDPKSKSANSSTNTTTTGFNPTISSTSKEKCCWATMTITEVVSQATVLPTSTALKTISTSVIYNNTNTFLRDEKYSTVTQTVTQRILSLQNVRLVRKYPTDE